MNHGMNNAIIFHYYFFLHMMEIIYLITCGIVYLCYYLFAGFFLRQNEKDPQRWPT